jgi:hypothetical protein
MAALGLPIDQQGTANMQQAGGIGAMLPPSSTSSSSRGRRRRGHDPFAPRDAHIPQGAAALAQRAEPVDPSVTSEGAAGLLPVAQYRTQLLYLVEMHAVTVVCGETGRFVVRRRSCGSGVRGRQPFYGRPSNCCRELSRKWVAIMGCFDYSLSRAQALDCFGREGAVGGCSWFLCLPWGSLGCMRPPTVQLSS